MRGLIFHLILIFPFFKHQTRAGERAMQHNVDFIEGKPVFHQTIKCYKASPGVAAEKLHQLAVTPGAIFGDQMHRHIEVAQRDQRFDTVLFTLFKYRAIKSNALLVGRQFIALREEAAPGN